VSRAPSRAAALGLLAACHPLPCLAVTAFAVGYAAAVGRSGPGAGAGTLLLVAAAVLTGQLTVGWTNDWLDADRDAAAGRRDKPVATGAVSRSAVGAAAVLAGACCVPLSLGLGLRPGLLHLVAVGSALGYDAGLKAGPFSPLPYLLSFGLLPVVVATAVSGAAPPAGVVVAAALLGLAAHFANTVPDAVADAATGVRGLPQRLGPARSLLVTAAGVALAALVLLATATHRGPLAVSLLAAGAVLAGTGVPLTVRARRIAPDRPPGRSAFRLTLVAVALVVAGFLVAG
jgi:4-hydroxybenzoate polyprenyltransferase